MVRRALSCDGWFKSLSAHNILETNKHTNKQTNKKQTDRGENNAVWFLEKSAYKNLLQGNFTETPEAQTAQFFKDKAKSQKIVCERPTHFYGKTVLETGWTKCVWLALRSFLQYSKWNINKFCCCKLVDSNSCLTLRTSHCLNMALRMAHERMTGWTKDSEEDTETKVHCNNSLGLPEVNTIII